MNVPGIAKILNVSEKTVRKMMLEEEIKGKKLGRKWYARGAILKAHFEEDKAPTSQPMNGKQKKHKK